MSSPSASLSVPVGASEAGWPAAGSSQGLRFRPFEVTVEGPADAGAEVYLVFALDEDHAASQARQSYLGLSGAAKGLNLTVLVRATTANR